MTMLHDLLPQPLLTAAPVPERCYSLADYMDHLLDAQPELFSATLPFAGHDDLAELVLMRMWTRGRVWDRQALNEIADHPDCDFWIVLSILLRVFPAPNSGPEVREMTAALVRRMAAGEWRMRHSDTPVICDRSVDIYTDLTRNQPEFSLPDALANKARAHAAWVERGRVPGRGFAMFEGRAVFAANTSDQD